MSSLMSIVRWPLRTFSPEWLKEKVRARRRAEQEIRDYESTSRNGFDSPNEWIRKSSEIGGWLFKGEHEFLWELATRQTKGDIVEIGSWMGKSACILAGACKTVAPGTKMICIDTFRMHGTESQMAYHKQLVGDIPGTFYRFLENAERLGFHDAVCPIGAYSTIALPLLAGNFRMAFVDGAHDYAGCKADVDLCLPMLAIGGVLAIHDVVGPYWPDLQKYADAELSKDSRLKYIGQAGTIIAYERVA